MTTTQFLRKNGFVRGKNLEFTVQNFNGENVDLTDLLEGYLELKTNPKLFHSRK